MFLCKHVRSITSGCHGDGEGTMASPHSARLFKDRGADGIGRDARRGRSN